MLWRGFVIFLNVTIFWSNYKLDLRSYAELFVLVYFYKSQRKEINYKIGENIIASIKMRNNILPFKNGNFSNIAIAILDFSLLIPV